jgi:hypothetical protein
MRSPGAGVAADLLAETTTTPPFRTRRLAGDRTDVISPVHRITTASTLPAYSSPRLSVRDAITATCESSSSRTTVNRKDARRCRASIRITATSGRAIAIGIPGNPAPDPISASALAVDGTAPKKARLCNTTFSISHDGSTEPTSRWVFCHLPNKFRYLTSIVPSEAVRARSRPGIGDSNREGGRTITSRRRRSRICDRERHHPAQRRAARPFRVTPREGRPGRSPAVAHPAH